MSSTFLRLVVVLIAWTLTAALPQGQDQGAAAARVTILGTVVDASLSPLPGVVVTLERADRAIATTTTDGKGAFRFTDVAPATYRIRAETKGLPAFAREVRISGASGTVQLPIVLAATPAASSSDAAARSTGQAAPPPAAVAAPPPAAPAAASAGGRGGSAQMSIDSVAAREGRGSVMNDSVLLSWPDYGPPAPGERYATIYPNRFQSTVDRPLSTFGADVDTASFSNVRRFLSSGQLPPADAVRVEELVNYFQFDYPSPRDGRSISLTAEIGDCPWAPAHRLVLIGARARASVPREIEGRNVVLLIDVSGSMAPPERLPLIKTALGMFVDTLRADDRIAIVTYAGSSGIVLPSTAVRERGVIQRAISSLSAGGSTNGGQGLITAYRTAREAFIPGGVNRVILATDGDFNVGIVRQADLFRLIEREKESGVFLSVLGVGSGNLKDSTMEMLADRGNGHYAYLDSLQEARRVLIREGDATLETVAKDVKFQVEFNPALVTAWKLIGYENRRLASRDFNDDRKDGGEMGAGHRVTVLYEVIPAGVRQDDEPAGVRPEVDPLKYQARPPVIRPVPDLPYGRGPSTSSEWLTVKARYKTAEGEESRLLTQAVRAGGRVQHLPLASAVAEFGLLLRDAPHDAGRWEALARRVARLEFPGVREAEKDAFQELVSIARGLARLR